MDKDVIYRQDAIDAMWKIRRQLQMLDDTHKADRVMHGIYLAKKALEQLPSATERKTGKWEIYVISMIDGEGCRCSECGFEGAPYWDFCPNCGSYNGGEQDGER